MIGCTEIQKAISELLKARRLAVIARESAEGGARPSCSVDVFPASSERTGQYTAYDTFGVEVIYYPKSETQEVLAKAADNFKKIFLYSPLEIEGRTLLTYRVDFSKEAGVLVMECEYIVTQEFEYDDDTYETMEELDFEV